jgi:hypothetical protein
MFGSKKDMTTFLFNANSAGVAEQPGAGFAGTCCANADRAVSAIPIHNAVFKFM